LTLCGHFPSHIVEGLLRRLVSDRGMASLPVVEDLNVFEDCGLGFRPCFESYAGIWVMSLFERRRIVAV